MVSSEQKPAVRPSHVRNRSWRVDVRVAYTTTRTGASTSARPRFSYECRSGTSSAATLALLGLYMTSSTSQRKLFIRKFDGTELYKELGPASLFEIAHSCAPSTWQNPFAGSCAVKESKSICSTITSATQLSDIVTSRSTHYGSRDCRSTSSCVSCSPHSRQQSRLVRP